jgi:hypothetical protein
MKEINNVCSKCGITANVLTCLKKYKDTPKKLCFDQSTFHIGICDCCGTQTEVTEARDFFHPDFSLITIAKNILWKPNQTLMNKEKLEEMLIFYKKAYEEESNSGETIKIRPKAIIDILEAILEP